MVKTSSAADATVSSGSPSASEMPSPSTRLMVRTARRSGLSVVVKRPVSLPSRAQG